MKSIEIIIENHFKIGQKGNIGLWANHFAIEQTFATLSLKEL
jgi:hypothetical protein